MLFSFIIVNYNTWELLKECVDNLIKMRESIPDSEIIVVDNGSFDGSVEMLYEKYSDKVISIKNPVNKLSAGHNLGYKRAKGKYIVHLGTDCFPRVDALVALQKLCESDPKIGICTGKVINRDGGIDWDAHRGFITPWTALFHFIKLDTLFPKSKVFGNYFLTYKDMTQPHEIDVCISHFMFVPQKTYDLVGDWDETYVVYGEDVDFCYRVKEAGLKVMYYPEIEILHYKGSGVGRKITSDLDNASRRDYKNLKKIRHETTNAMLIFYKKHLAKKYPAMVNILVYTGIWLLKRIRSLMYVLKGRGY